MPNIDRINVNGTSYDVTDTAARTAAENAATAASGAASAAQTAQETASNAVSYAEAQTISDEGKTTARGNIGAASADDLHYAEAGIDAVLFPVQRMPSDEYYAFTTNSGIYKATGLFLSSAKYFRTKFLTYNDANALVFTLGLADYKWTSWSYQNANASNPGPTHSNTENDYISCTQPLYVQKKSEDDNYMVVVFARVDGANMTTSDSDPDSDYYKIQRALKILMMKQPDTTLAVSGASADAKTVGDILFASRNAVLESSEPLLRYAYASGDTWQDVPLGSFAFMSNTSFATLYPDFPESVGSSVFVEVYGGRKTSGGTVIAKRARIIRVCVLSRTPLFYYGYVTESATSITWRKISGSGGSGGGVVPSISIAYFGDSITRGIINTSGGGTANNTDNIPNGVATELGCNMQNFGIGSIGWCNDGGSSANKGIAYEYLKRWATGDSDYYGDYVPGVSYPGYKFIGTGTIDDFDTVVLAYGANDNADFNLGSIDDVAQYDSVSDPDTDAMTEMSIITQMYRCVRYLKMQNSSLNIIIVAPFVAGSSAPNGDYDITHGDHTKRTLIQAYEAFCQKYGCGFISTYDAPIDRWNLLNVLTANVHPTVPTYHALGKYMAGKISALAL